MYDTLLVATDGSPPAEAAVERAVALAAAVDADLRAVSVVDTMAYGLADVGSGVALEALREDAQGHVEAVAEAAAAAGVDCTTAVQTGEPARTVAEHAEETGVDLVVVGTHGRRGVSRFLLGSVAEWVARTAPVSVLIVRQGVVEGEGTVGTDTDTDTDAVGDGTVHEADAGADERGDPGGDGTGNGGGTDPGSGG